MRWHFIALLGVVVFLVNAAPGQQASPPAASQPATQKALKQEELDQLLAPIALYPDTLLSQVLMAATYPVEVVQAQRWFDAHKELKGDALATELEKQDWEASVKSLVNFPQVLAMMSEKLDWTMKLGNAFLAQPQEVMKTVQALRGKAKDQGNLETNKEQKVVVESAGTPAQTIVIQPADPQVIYVPTYNPTVVYGTWGYPAYPPYYYYPPNYNPHPGLWFGAGVAVGAAWGYAWGNCDWGHNNVDIDVNRNVNVNNRIDRNRYQAEYNRNGANIQGNRGTWQHSPTHRQGAAYSDQAVAQRMGQKPSAASNSYRGYNSTPSQPWYEKEKARTQSQANAAGNRQQPGQSPNRTAQATPRPQQQPAPRQAPPPQRSAAFDNVNNGARQTQNYSNRGRSSMGGGGGGGGARSAPRGGGGGRR